MSASNSPRRTVASAAASPSSSEGHTCSARRIPTSRRRCSGSSATKGSNARGGPGTSRGRPIRKGCDAHRAHARRHATHRGQRHPGRLGRTPNTAGIGLEEAGVELDARGYVRVNERLETSAPDVWAIGECAGSPHFTHASVDDFRIIMDNLAGGKRSTRDRLIPYCVFTDPPLAHVGLHEGDLRRQGVTARVAKLPMNAVLRVQASGEGPGFMKVLVGASDDRIRGFTMIGPEAGEVVSAVQVAMLAGLPYPKLRDAVLAHLTMAEGLGFLLSNVENAEK